MIGSTPAARINLSYFGFSLKAVCAFSLSWMAANNLPVDDFAIWAVFFSISMVMSSGDFGVGQYILTYMTSSKYDSVAWASHFCGGLSALIVLAIPVFCLGMIVANAAGIDLLFSGPLCILVIARLPMIAYAALLQVQDRIHEKRLLDAAPYVIAIPIMYAMHLYELSVYQQLIAINFLLAVGGFCTMLRCNTLGVPPYMWVGMVTIFSTLKKSFPYLLNSASGILIYGGFIGIFSFYLDSYHIAILSIYHTVILSLGYQGYDVIFRNYQLRINEPKVFKRLCLFLLLSGTFVFSLLTLIGVPTLELFYSSYNFIEAELILFCCFSFLEFGYLLATTRLQMSVSGASVLYRAAITKICLFLVTASCAFYVADLTIVKLLCCLILFSVVNILNLIRMQRSITPEFRSNGLYEKNSNQSN